MREAVAPLLVVDTREPFLLKMCKDFAYFLSITACSESRHDLALKARSPARDTETVGPGTDGELPRGMSG